MDSNVNTILVTNAIGAGEKSFLKLDKRCTLIYLYNWYKHLALILLDIGRMMDRVSDFCLTPSA